MFNATYSVRLTKKTFPDSKYICLGWQLSNILTELQKVLPFHIWFASDVSVKTSFPGSRIFKSTYLKKIGDISSMNVFASSADLFLSGVFIAIQDEEQISKHRIKLEADDIEHRSILLNGVFIEIRAVETAHFDIYSDDFELIDKLAIAFNSVIVKAHHF